MGLLCSSTLLKKTNVTDESCCELCEVARCCFFSNYQYICIILPCAKCQMGLVPAIYHPAHRSSENEWTKHGIKVNGQQSLLNKTLMMHLMSDIKRFVNVFGQMIACISMVVVPPSEGDRQH